MFPFFLALYNHSQVSIVALWATCKYMGSILDAEGQLAPMSVIKTDRNFNSSKILSISFLSANQKKDLINGDRKNVDTLILEVQGQLSP